MNLIQLYAARILCLITCFGTGLLAPLSMHALERQQDLKTHQLAKRLETHFWNTVKDHNLEGLEKAISLVFQGNASSGIYTREQQITGLASVGSFNFFDLQNLIAFRDDDIIVISYYFIADSPDLINGPTISVWKKGKCHWHLISHSYFPAL